jgi:hypothetical protein
MTDQPLSPPRVPDLVLARYRLGGMTPDEAAAFERRVRGDNELWQRLQALETTDEEIRCRYPADVLAAAVVLLLLVGPPLLGPANDPGDRVKGLEPTLLLFRKTPEGSEPLRDGATVARLSTGSQALLDCAYELDAAPSLTRFSRRGGGSSPCRRTRIWRRPPTSPAGARTTTLSRCWSTRSPEDGLPRRA